MAGIGDCVLGVRQLSNWLRVIVISRNRIGVVIEFYRNYYVKDVVLFEENPILPLPERSESSGW